MSVRHERHAWMVKQRKALLAQAKKSDGKALAAFEQRAAEQRPA